MTAPSPLREDLDQLATAALVATCARLRPEEAALADPVQATKAALRVVACRIRQLNEGVRDARSSGDTVQPPAQADQRADGPEDIADPVQQPAPTA